MSGKMKFILRCLLVMIIFLFAGFFAYRFSYKLNTTLENQQYKTLGEVAAYNNQALTSEIEQKIKILDMVAQYSTYYQNKSMEELCEFLQTVTVAGSFDRIGVSDIDGNAVFNDGDVNNISHRWYFKKSVEGNKSIDGPLTSNVTGNPTLVFSTPIFNDGKVTGIVQGTYELQTAGKILLRSANENEQYTIVTNSSGEILFCNMYNYDYDIYNNIFNMIDEDTIKEPYDSDSILRDIAQRNSGRFEFRQNNQYSYGFFSPVGINDWYAFQIIPDTGLIEERKSFNSISITMLMSYLVLLCIIFLIFFYSYNLKEKEIKMKITHEKEKHYNLLSHIKGGMVILEYSDTSDSGSVIYMNDVFERMLGYSIEEIKSKFNGDTMNMIHPDDNPEEIRAYCKSLKNGESYQLQYRLQRKDGSYIWTMDSGYIYVDENNNKINQILFSDISILKEHENELKLSAESLRIASRLISGCVFEYDLIQKKYIILENIEKIIGKKNKYILEKYNEYSEDSNNFFQAFLYFFHPNERRTAVKAYAKLIKNGNAVFQARLDKNGNYIWCKFHLVMVYNEHHVAERVIGNIMDINDTRCQMEHLQNIADHDHLTEVYNRQAFVANMEKVLSAYPKNYHAFFLLDVDNFKGINDNYGHGFGDFVLKNLAGCLKEIFHDSTDYVGRLGGDEFVVFMSKITNKQDVYNKAERICELYKTPVTDGALSATVSYSVGISLYSPSNTKNRSMLYKQADTALYISKEGGKNRYTVYDDVYKNQF